MTTPSPTLAGRRVHVAGSANEKDPEPLRVWAHEFVRSLVEGILERGGGLVLGVGREPLAAVGGASLVFDWTALEAAEQSLDGTGWPGWAGPRLVLGMSAKSQAEVPAPRLPLLDRLLARPDVEARSILPGSRSGAMLRQEQARFGNVLVTLGGGTGVEHLAELYRADDHPVVALDLPLHASRGDGMGGSPLLAASARAAPAKFIRLAKGSSAHPGALLAAMTTRGGAAEAHDVASAAIRVLESLAPPRAFYIRLLNRSHERWASVERYFREVVDVVVHERGAEWIDLGADRAEHGFGNVEVFESLHHADFVICDLTAERPNCFVEFGYALRSRRPALLTAEEGTKLPFDVDKVHCCFWGSRAVEQLRDELRVHWDRYFNRGPIVASGKAP